MLDAAAKAAVRQHRIEHGAAVRAKAREGVGGGAPQRAARPPTLGDGNVAVVKQHDVVVLVEVEDDLGPRGNVDVVVWVLRTAPEGRGRAAVLSHVVDRGGRVEVLLGGVQRGRSQRNPRGRRRRGW
ncbi:MAG: hypothetical protein CMM02_14075, partial [Rhodopirellula sp.]|nr:hypothetical protein [Rhodopirellula sp.]